MKKFSVILSILVILSTFTISYGQNQVINVNENYDLTVTQGISIDAQLEIWNKEDGVTVKLITEDEWIRQLANENNMSYDTVKSIEQNGNQLYNDIIFNGNKISPLSEVSYYYLTFEKVNNYYGDGNYAAAVGGGIKLASIGSFRWIDSVVNSYSRPAQGNGVVDWVELGKWHNISSNSNSVSFFAQGYFRIETTSTLSIGWILGYSIGETNLYTSNTIIISGQFNAH